jgi:hypothetical protein
MRGVAYTSVHSSTVNIHRWDVGIVSGIDIDSVETVNGWRDMRCVAEMSDTLIDSQHPEMDRGISMLLMGRKGSD